MKKFRSAEEWKSALMNLPESNFFELMRSVFGNIKTPFNKQRLLEDLSNLLSRDEIKKVISAFISEQDHRLIAAVALLGEPAQGVLESFFAGEYNYAELHAIVVNLEERLIIYRFKDEGLMRLALNPVLEEVLVPFIEDPSLIFPSFPKTDSGPAPGMGDPRYMAAIITFFAGEEELFKTETGALSAGSAAQGNKSRGIRKKVLDEWKKIFPLHDPNLTVQTTLQLGLFSCEGRRLVPNSEKIADFAALSALERQEYWAAAACLSLNEASRNENVPGVSGGLGILGGSSKSRLRAIASLIHRFRTWIDPERIYPETTLRRLDMLLARTEEVPGKAWGYSLFDSKVQVQFEQLLAVMENSDLLEKEKSCWKATKAASEIRPGDEKPVIAMDSAFSILLYPEISFKDALALGSFCSVKGNPFYLELSRHSAVRGFDSGLDSGGMTELLGRLSGNRIDSSLGWTLKEWESRHEGVALYQGTVLCLAEDHRYLAETGPLSSLIARTFAPGVYLLSSEEKSEAAAALRKAGVSIIAQPAAGKVPAGKVPAGKAPTGKVPAQPKRSIHRLSRESFPRLDSGGAGLPRGGAAAGIKKTGETEAILERFRRILDKMKLNKQEKEELSARIDRRLVLSEAQLEGTFLRYEKTEASLLDYRGKLSIARKAVQSGSLVEVSWTGPGGRSRKFTGIAQALEKEEGDSILVLRKAEDSSKTKDSSGGTIRVPLGKVSLLRRIKQSIFGG